MKKLWVLVTVGGGPGVGVFAAFRAGFLGSTFENDLRLEGAIMWSISGVFGAPISASRCVGLTLRDGSAPNRFRLRYPGCLVWFSGCSKE